MENQLVELSLRFIAHGEYLGEDPFNGEKPALDVWAGRLDTNGFIHSVATAVSGILFSLNFKNLFQFHREEGDEGDP